MTLKYLAPDIQEEIAELHISAECHQYEEKAMRAIALISNWQEQRRLWHVYRNEVL
jgi:uncharacterized protein (UPF0335 family)